MKTVTILLSFLANEHGIVHEAAYETQFDNCYQAERAVLNQAWIDYVDTGKAKEISIESCEEGVTAKHSTDPTNYSYSFK